MGIIAKQSIRGTIWTYIGVAVGLVTVFFVQTRFLTSEEIGLARVMIDAATLFIGLAQLGACNSIIRFFPYFKQKDKSQSDGLTSAQTGATSSAQTGATQDPYHGFFFWAVVIPLVGFVLFAVIFYWCRVPIANYFSEKSPLFVNYYYFLFPLAFFMLYQVVFESCSNVLLRTVFPRSVVREVLIRVFLLVLYLLYAFRVVSIDGFVIGLCCVYALAALLNIVYVVATEHISFRPDFGYLTRGLVVKFLSYTGFLLLSAAVTQLSPLLSSFMVTAQLGLSFTGVYAIATYIAVMVSIPSRSMYAITQPQLSEALKENDRQQASHLLRQVSGTLLLIGAALMLVIWINIDLIFHIMPNGETYAVGKRAVLLLLFTQLMIGSLNIMQAAISYSRHYYLLLLLSLMLTVLLIVFNNHLIPTYGIDGAALATMLGNMVFYVVMLVVVVGVLRLQPIGKAYLEAALLLALMMVGNYLWMKYLTPMIGNIWADSILRTVVFMTAYCAAAYWLKISPEVNDYAANLYSKLKSNF